MTNREKILNTNIYDFLLTIFFNENCLFKKIDNDYLKKDCVFYKEKRMPNLEDCDKCIQNWLNKETNFDPLLYYKKIKEKE